MKVAKWGNSLAVRLPKAVVDELELKPNDEIVLTIAGHRNLGVQKAPDKLEKLEQLRKYRGLMPADFKFDREEANSRD